MNFRYDINGLRAIAVIAVVIFHFNADWLPGGFAGVDVFFVISGYLMTAIILKGLDKQDFSLRGFYLARANRILPALAALCITLTIFGWFYLTNIDYQAVGKHLAASMTFVSNLVYWSEVGYFDSVSSEKWLLHTWSLSVEWQFYLIYPLALLALNKVFTHTKVKQLIVVATVLGFALGLVMSFRSPDAAYYLLFTRAWEMLLGGIAFIYPWHLSASAKKWTEAFGLVLIGSAYILASDQIPWPGYMALLPTLGAYLVIIANRQDSLITNNAPFQALGKWSYSLYLWHWPIAVYGYYFQQPNWFYIGILLSLGMAILSYYLVERHRFSPITLVKRPLDIKVVTLSLLVSLMGLYVFLSEGARWHYPANLLDMTSIKWQYPLAPAADPAQSAPRDGCHGTGDIKHCRYENDNIGVIVVGDSHAQSMIATLEQALPKPLALLDWTMNGCRPIMGLVNTRQKGVLDSSCGAFIAHTLQKIKAYPNVPVVINSRYNALLFGPNEPEFAHRREKPDEFTINNLYHAKRDNQYITEMNQAFADTLCAYAANNPVYLLEPTPELKLNVPKTMARAWMLGEQNFRVSITTEEYQQRNQTFFSVASKVAKQCDVHLIKLTQHFCDSNRCYGDHFGKPVYIDDDHLNYAGTSVLMPTFKQTLGRYWQ